MNLVHSANLKHIQSVQWLRAALFEEKAWTVQELKLKGTSGQYKD